MGKLPTLNSRGISPFFQGCHHCCCCCCCCCCPSLGTPWCLQGLDLSQLHLCEAGSQVNCLACTQSIACCVHEPEPCVHTVTWFSPLCTCILHSTLGLHLQGISSKIKLVRISRWYQQNIKQSMWPLMRLGSCAITLVPCL